jgi:hypothetical protein
MPSNEDSAEHYRLLKVRNLESFKRDHFRPYPVPFDSPLTMDMVANAAAAVKNRRARFSPYLKAAMPRPASTTARQANPRTANVIGSVSFGSKLLTNPIHKILNATTSWTDVNTKTLSVNE